MAVCSCFTSKHILPLSFVHLQNSRLRRRGILNRHLSGKSQKFVLCWCNVGPIHGCGWTNIFDVGPALIQHVLTVMYCVCWAHNRLRLRTSVGLIWGQCHRSCVNIRTTSRRDITNLWSLYPASQQTRDIVPMLVHRLRCWPNIEPTMGQCIVFAGLNEPFTPVCFTHEGGERPMSLKLQNQFCKAQNRRVLVL